MASKQQIADVARKLTKGAARACLAMTGDWQFCGKATFDANGAHNLFWKCGGFSERNQFVELQTVNTGKGARYAYRLTPLGEQVRAHLKEPT